MDRVASPPQPRPFRVLVVANDEIRAHDVPDLIAPDNHAGPVETLVVAPALNAFLGRAVTDAATAERGRGATDRRRRADVERRRHPQLRNRFGDADPLLAIEDAVDVYQADEVVIAVGVDQSTGSLGAESSQNVPAPAWRCRFGIRSSPAASLRPDGYGLG